MRRGVAAAFVGVGLGGVACGELAPTSPDEQGTDAGDGRTDAAREGRTDSGVRSDAGTVFDGRTTDERIVPFLPPPVLPPGRAHDASAAQDSDLAEDATILPFPPILPPPPPPNPPPPLPLK